MQEHLENHLILQQEAQKVSSNCPRNRHQSKKSSASRKYAKPANVQENSLDAIPSPSPTPISKSVPVSPVALEPSLYLHESSSNNLGKNKQFLRQKPPACITTTVCSVPSAFNYQGDDDLIPSFYETSSSHQNNPQSLQTFAQPPLTLTSKSVLHSSTLLKQNEVPEKNCKVTRPSDTVTSAIQLTQPLSTIPFSVKNFSWFKVLPPAACKFYEDQNELIKSLQAEITQLEMQLQISKKLSKTDVGVQVTSNIKNSRSMHDVGVNTDEVVTEMSSVEASLPKENFSSIGNELLVDLIRLHFTCLKLALCFIFKFHLFW